MSPNRWHGPGVGWRRRREAAQTQLPVEGIWQRRAASFLLEPLCSGAQLAGVRGRTAKSLNQTNTSSEGPYAGKRVHIELFNLNSGATVKKW